MSDKRDLYFFCYSPSLTHYLKANGLKQIRYGFNMGSGAWYTVFERGQRLAKLLEKWDNFKMQGETKHAGKPDEQSCSAN